MNTAMEVPGWANAWTMPIKARIDMLATGIRTPVGIKIFGTNLTGIENIGIQIEKTLSGIKGTRSVFAERAGGGYYIDFDIKRNEIARYGLKVEDINDIIETAVGGMLVTTTIEGRERYPVSIRYPRELRTNIEALKKVLVPVMMTDRIQNTEYRTQTMGLTSGAAQIPFGQLVDIRLRAGPASIKNESGFLVAYVYVDISERDVGGYVEEAKKAVESNVKMPAGYSIQWSGQYEYMQRVKEKLKIVIPLTLTLIFILLYLNFRSAAESLIVMLSVPFSLVGSFLLLYLLGYNLSIAVWVGIIALAGVAAETGVVMIVYLDEAYNKRVAEGQMNTMKDLYNAVMEGAVQRVRPKIMTVLTTIVGLLPLMWATGPGADVGKRIAAPMVGGMVTSTILTLVIIPAVYMLWKGRGLGKR